MSPLGTKLIRDPDLRAIVYYHCLNHITAPRGANPLGTHWVILADLFPLVFTIDSRTRLIAERAESFYLSQATS